jgi:hypothetical protein
LDEQILVDELRFDTIQPTGNGGADYHPLHRNRGAEVSQGVQHGEPARLVKSGRAQSALDNERCGTGAKESGELDQSITAFLIELIGPL